MLHLGRNNREPINHRQKSRERNQLVAHYLFYFGEVGAKTLGLAEPWLWGWLSSDSWFVWAMTRFGCALALCSIGFGDLHSPCLKPLGWWSCLSDLTMHDLDRNIYVHVSRYLHVVCILCLYPVVSSCDSMSFKYHSYWRKNQKMAFLANEEADGQHVANYDIKPPVCRILLRPDWGENGRTVPDSND